MIEVNTVKQLDFSALYLGHLKLEDRYSDASGAEVKPILAGTRLREDLDQLIAACRRTLDAHSTVTEFKTQHDNIAYRVSVMHTRSGEVFVLRRIIDSIPTLSELGIPQAYVRHLMAKNLSGLFVVAGAIKSGKTTTACAMLKDRLIAYGGVAVSAEDPIELPLEGSHGNGVCYQTVSSRGAQDCIDGFRQAIRWGAKTILIDEIRTHDIAIEALQASFNGHLVITTMLAANVIQTINKLHVLVAERLPLQDVQALLAEGLVGVLHQQLMPSTKQKVETEFLFFKNEPMAKTVLRNGKYELLGTDIKRQMALMITDNATAQRIAET